MTMRRHLEEDVLLDVIEGSASAEATRHARECADCSARLTDARAGLAMAMAADAPDPSPLFWDVLRRRVASEIDGVRPPVRSRFGAFVAPALLATAATVAVLSFVPRSPRGLAVSPAPMAAASSAPQFDEATSDAAMASMDDLGCQDVEACVASLTDEESSALADALRAELAGSGDL
jgi:hypothetical protein